MVIQIEQRNEMNAFISLDIDNRLLAKAFRIAIGDYVGNIQPWQGALDDSPSPCILAGVDYNRPWTRDASINSWYAGSLLTPTIARNTLLAVLTKDHSGLRIGGEYWDAIIWVTAAWNHYLCTSDKEFLEKAFEVSSNSIAHLEKTEYDPGDGLFRGGACFQDGIAGYPDCFADGPSSGILDWVQQHPAEKATPGYGLPMKALSTNCLYYNAYQMLQSMAAELHVSSRPEWNAKAQRLKDAINQKFWDPERGIYRYLVDASDDLGRHEGFGHAFAILFGIADEDQCKAMFEHQHITKHGIPCVWPTYKRYTNQESMSYGRHSGTIWPQVNTAWTMAASQCNRRDVALFELRSLAEKACRDVQFAELYHPITGEIYGGMQESCPGKLIEWDSCQRQTWCATGFIQMVLSTLFGHRITTSGISYSPYIPPDVTRMMLSGLSYRNATISVCAERSDDGPSITVNNVEQKEASIPADASGPQYIYIRVPKGSNPATDNNSDAGDAKWPA